MAVPGSTVEACVSRVMSETCRPAADAVAAGLATYHPEAEAGCLEAHASSDVRRILKIRPAPWRI